MHKPCNNCCVITYSHDELLQIKNTVTSQVGSLSAEIKSKLYELGVLKRRRGRRAGRHMRKRIPVLTQLHMPSSTSRVPIHRMLTPIPRTTDSEASFGTGPQKCKPMDFPVFLLTNTQSLVNKLDEFEVTMNRLSIEIGVVSKTWFRPDLSDGLMSIDGYDIFSKSRSYGKGSGVACEIEDINVQDELKCRWVLVQPKRLPRSVSLLAVCGVYSPPNSPHHELLQQFLTDSMDALHTKYPDIGFAILGDFNKIDIKPVLRNNNLKQIIKFPTRGNAILDLILTNISSFLENQ